MENYPDELAACPTCKGSGDSHDGGFWHDCPACGGTGEATPRREVMDMSPKCKGCGKGPDEISEYVSGARIEKCTPTQYVRDNEGTFNPVTGKFYCDTCYIKAGMPLGKA